jgi:hypothetical protein
MLPSGNITGEFVENQRKVPEREFVLDFQRVYGSNFPLGNFSSEPMG